MSNSGTSRSDRRNSDDMHRQSSRTTTYADDVVVAVDTNDLLDNDVIASDHRSHRRSESSRRDHSSKRSYESSSSSQHRPSRHSPPPASSHKRHHSSQRASPPPSSSRHQRSSRPSSTLKRSHSRSRSPHERPTHRSRPQHVDENSSTKKPLPPPPNESADLSTISEDEATKPTDQRSTRPKVHPTTESSSTPISHKITANETSFDTSQVAADHDLSLFPNSILSATSSVPPPPPPTTSNDLLQAIDLLGKYKTMQSIPSVDPQILACEKEILQIIQKKIDLQKKETQINERALKLRELELAEREKQLEPAAIDEKAPPVEPMEKEENPLETKIEALSDDSTRPTRKNGGKSRFSAPSVEPAATTSSSESDERTPTSHLGATTSESQPSMSLIDAELKVISTNSCRKVEISGATTEKKNTSDDLRHTISKNRSKQVENGDHSQSNESNGSRLISDDEQKITISQVIPPKNDDKPANFDFHSQRSFTSSDNADEPSPHDKRRSQPRTDRRQQSFSNDRSNFSTSQSSRYGSNSKRYENEDLRSHLHETKTSRSSRTNYRNNH